MDDRDRQNIAVALVVIVLIGLGVWLMQTLHRQGLVEDCLMARRRNCDALLSH